MDKVLRDEMYSLIATVNASFYKQLHKALGHPAKFKLVPKGSTVCFGLLEDDSPELDVSVVLDLDESHKSGLVLELSENDGFEIIEKDRCFELRREGVILDVSFCEPVGETESVRHTVPAGVSGKISCPAPYTEWLASAHRAPLMYYRGLKIGKPQQIKDVEIENAYSQAIRFAKNAAVEVARVSGTKKIPSFILMYFLRRSWSPDISLEANTKTAFRRLSDELRECLDNGTSFELRNPFDAEVVLSDRWPRSIEQKKIICEQLRELSER